MKKKHLTILLVVVGAGMFMAALCIAAVVWFFVSVFDRDAADQTTATRNVTEIRQRFGGVEPVFEIEEEAERVTVNREPPAGASQARLNSLHAFIWNPDNEAVIRMDLPFWLLRLKKGPIHISSSTAPVTRRLNFTVDDVERYGPALLVDFEDDDGERLLLWTD